MIKTILMILLFFCIATSCYAGGLIMGGGVLTVGGSTYVGWPNSDGTPTGAPTSESVAGEDAIVTTQWTATENGTIKTIQFYTGSLWAADGASVVVYKDITGTKTLIGKGTATVPGTAQWIAKTTVTVESGQSLTFATNDVLYFGVYYYDILGSSSRVGREDAGGTGGYYQTLSGETGTPPATFTSTLSASRLMSFILEYE